MGLIYIDSSNTNPNSGSYNVFAASLFLGIVEYDELTTGGRWKVKIGNRDSFESQTFDTKDSAGKYLLTKVREMLEKTE
jgi:hypothetical protein